MCILWSTEYYLCGHTRPDQSRSYPCSKSARCTQRKYIIVQSNLQTCRVCWDAGDRRVNKLFAKMLIRHAAERQERQQRKAERYFVREVLRRRQGLSDYAAASDSERFAEEAEGDGRGADSEQSGRCRAQTGLKNQACPEGEVEYEAESEGKELEEVKDKEDAEKEVDIEDEEGPDREKRFESPSEIARPDTPLIHWKLVKRYQPLYDDLPRVCDPVRLGSIRKDYRARRGRSWE